MKIRNGFVSNSSSSSFVCIGKNINANDITDDMLKNKDIEIMCIGKHHICDGQDVFRLQDISLFKFIKEYGLVYDFRYMNCCKVIFEAYEYNTTIELEKGKYNFVSGEADMHSSCTIQGLCFNYLSKIKHAFEEKYPDEICDSNSVMAKWKEIQES